MTRYTLAKHEPILIEKMIIVKSQETLLLEGVSEQVLMRSQNRYRSSWDRLILSDLSMNGT